MDYLLDQIVRFRGLESIHIVVNDKFIYKFVDWIVTWQNRVNEKGIELVLYNNGVRDIESRLGAGGDLYFVLDQGNLFGKNALIAAGDNIFLFDLINIWEDFYHHPKNLLLALEEIDQRRLKRSGVLGLDPNDKVLSFQEKPEQPNSNWLCPALYFLQGDGVKLIHEYLETANSTDAIGDFINFLVNNTDIYATRSMDKRLDLGSMEDFENANNSIESTESSLFI